MKNIIIILALLLTSSLNLHSACPGYSVSIRLGSDGGLLGDVTASADITFNGGSSHYAIFWDSIRNDNTVSDFLGAGAHQFVIYDSVANCYDTTNFNLTDFGNCPPVDVSIIENDGCSYNDMSLRVLAANPNVPYPYHYQWNTGTTNEVTDNGLISGLYTVTVYIENSSCAYTASKQVYDDTCERCAMFKINLREVDSVGKNDIKIYSELKTWPYNPSNNYKYQWNTGDTTDRISYKSSGNYRLTVTDLTYGCVTDTVIKVVDDTSNLCIFMAYILENDYCDTNDIHIFCYLSVGNGPLKYKWSTGDSVINLYNKSTGTYTVYITDTITGCIYDTTLNIVDDVCDTCIYYTPSLSYKDTCQLNDVKIYIKLKDTVSSYTYLWSTGATSQVLSGVSSGTYRVTITRANGCIYTDSITVIDSIFTCCRASFNMVDSVIHQTFISNPNPSVISYGWSFGDNTTGTGQSVNHNYNYEGSYTVCHYIETSFGCKDTACNTVLIPKQGKNLKVIHYGSPYVLDTFKLTQIHYKNIGTTIEYPIVTYSFPIGCSLTNSTPAPNSNNGNLLTYNIGQLNPGQSGLISIKLDVPGTYTLGSLKGDTSKILSFINDVDTLNNVTIRQDSVVGSWDPNEKLAVPQGEGVDGNIPKNTKEINYLIHFQNEGNWRTYNVRVEDEIDPSLDITSLSLGDISHPYRMVVNGSKLTWYFDNIELTPKSQNEEKSKGYIAYSLKLKKGLNEGTKIKNTAYIYFDKNPAIVTNTTVHTLKVDAVTNGIQAVNLGSNQVLIQRNQNDLTLSSEKAIENIEVFNMNGQKVNETNSKSKKVEFEVSSWPSGIYFFNVKIKDEVHQLKIKL